jgi:hypothetical protein
VRQVNTISLGPYRLPVWPVGIGLCLLLNSASPGNRYAFSSVEQK